MKMSVVLMDTGRATQLVTSKPLLRRHYQTVKKEIIYISDVQ